MEPQDGMSEWVYHSLCCEQYEHSQTRAELLECQEELARVKAKLDSISSKNRADVIAAKAQAHKWHTEYMELREELEEQ